MAKYNNMGALQKALMAQINAAVQGMTDEVAQKCADKYQEYYADYSPRVYERTGQLGEAYMKSDVYSTGNTASSYAALVPNMEYSTPGADPVATLYNAALPGGFHGGYAKAPNHVPVFTESIEEIRSEERALWKKHLGKNFK